MITLIHAEPNRQPRIETIWVALSVDQSGEGIVTGSVGGVMMTLLTSEEHLVPKIAGTAKQLAKATGRSVRLVKFTAREDLRVINP